MKFTERSCGAVVFTREHGDIRFVIIKNALGNYGFPKGHMEGSETELETAAREIKEEAGLSVSFIPDFRMTDSHPLIREGRPNEMKEIVYFLAEFHGQQPSSKDREISEIHLMDHETAMAALRFDRLKEILSEAHNHLLRSSQVTKVNNSSPSGIGHRLCAPR